MIERLDVEPRRLTKLHIMPTSGTRYYRFDEKRLAWVQQYAEDLTDDEKKRVIDVLTEGAQHLGYWDVEHDCGNTRCRDAAASGHLQIDNAPGPHGGSGCPRAVARVEQPGWCQADESRRRCEGGRRGLQRRGRSDPQRHTATMT